MANTAYEEPTEDELKVMEEGMASAPVPPTEDDDSKPITPAQVEAEAAANAAPAAPAAGAAGADGAPVEGAAPAKEPTEDEKFAAFLKQHEGKSPEELAKLAFQQQNRAAQAGFTARQAREQAEASGKRIAEALAAVTERRKAIAGKRTEFDQRLQEDPDAATRDVHERLLTKEEQEAAQEEFQLRQQHMVSVAATVIPDFQTEAPRIAAFGAELNYTPEELGAITDPRDMVTLWMASHAGRLMRAGIMDFNGNLQMDKLPAAVAATDPRLAPTTPVIQTNGQTPGRSADGARSIEDQLAEIAKMTDKEMEQFERAHPGVLENLLRQAG
jgi:hypothetical protein